MHTATLRTLAIVACLAAQGAHADTRSFRCKNDLVKLGDAKSSALLKCGEPVVKDAFCKPTGQPGATTTPSSSSCETVDEWTYNPGQGQFMTTLRFESGALVAIKYGDRVK